MNDDQRLDYYNKLPYRLEIIPDTEEGGYAARYPQLKGCITCGDTLEEVLRNARDAKTAWLETAIRYGDHIPMPEDDSRFSGQFRLRLPRSLHRELSEQARHEGVSMNQYCLSVLSAAAATHAFEAHSPQPGAGTDHRIGV